MKYLLAIWVIIVLIGLFFIALINLADYGISGIVIVGISAFALFRCFKFLFFDAEAAEPKEKSPSSCSGAHDPLEYIIYGDIAGKRDPDDWDK